MFWTNFSFSTAQTGKKYRKKLVKKMVKISDEFDMNYRYVHKPPQGSVINQVIGSIWYATKQRFQSLRKPEHWLDHAKGKYSSQSIADTKILLRLLVVYLTFPIYWALFKQTGSRWTFQATR